jgi:hypothetical protein
MKNQIIVVHIHEDKKLFHVSMHNEDRVGKTNWKIEASRARSDWSRLLMGEDIDTRGFTGGFRIAMVNTNFEGWVTIDIPDSYKLDDAQRIKHDLNSEYEKRGYNNVGIRNFRSKNDPGKGLISPGWARKFNISNMTKQKIDAKIDFINTSLQMNITSELKSKAYLAVVRQNSKIIDMAGLLMYMHQELGVDQSILVAA